MTNNDPEFSTSLFKACKADSIIKAIQIQSFIRKNSN